MTPVDSRKSRRKTIRWLLLALLVAMPFLQVTGCAGPSYYTQAVSGHYRLMRGREDISQILSSDHTDSEMIRDLELAVEIREFATARLDLPDNGSYRQFVKTNRAAATWNVVAAPEFSLQPRPWCFMVSGCVPYRGYFEHEAAKKFANKLAEGGWDVTISPAIAYSTLGWFDDPLLDTMFQYGDAQLAAVIFHELAHQQLYVKGDAAFNESYASFVEDTGVQLWLSSKDDTEQLESWREMQKASLQFNALLLESGKTLETLYASSLPEEKLRLRKSEIFNGLQQDYQTLVKDEWNGRSYYEAWFSRDLNNARIALMKSYRGGVCAFEQLFRSVDGNLANFHLLVADKARLEREQRRAWLNQPCEVIASSHDL